MKRTVSTSDYVAGYRDVEKFLACCRECGNYGRCWACPPFKDDWGEVIAPYSKVTIYVTQLVFNEKIAMADAGKIIRPVRTEIEMQLRADEAATNGRAFAFAGKCLYCPDGECSRINDEPCRHPELVRPSLEALGFDLGKTATDLFNLPILWSTDKYLPEYYLLISGLFHN